MSGKKVSKQFTVMLKAAAKLVTAQEADALLIMVSKQLDWEKILNAIGKQIKLVVASTSLDALQGIDELENDQIQRVRLDMDEASIHELLTQAMLECVADEILLPGSSAVAVYSGFEIDQLDSLSLIRLSEHLGRLTARDLQRLETQVPLETLKAVVDLAVDIGREGREGKAVGTLFIVGDHRKVLAQSHSLGFDAVKGYTRSDRNLLSTRTKEAVKEIAQLDGAFIVAADGTVEATGRYIQTAPVDLTMTTGLGARHWTAAAISKNTKALSVVVSESSGTVRLFQDGQCVLRIEPFRRAMKWRESIVDPNPPASES